MWANHSGPSPKMSDVSKVLRSLTKNEQCERSAQVPHQKWVTMSDSLRWLTKNERITCFFEQFAHLLIICWFFLQKTSDSLRKPMSELPTLSIRSEKAVLRIRSEEVVLSIWSEVASWVFGQRRRFLVSGQRRQFWVCGQRRQFSVSGWGHCWKAYPNINPNLYVASFSYENDKK